VNEEDQAILRVARQLAEALADYAYSRKAEDKTRVSALQAELVRTAGVLPRRDAGPHAQVHT
jgi:hypothetical protein